MAGPTEQDQAAGIREGDERAFRSFFHDVYPDAVVFAERKLRDRQAAEDLAQDVFVDVWHDRQDIDPGKSLRGYVFTLISRRIVDHYRHLEVRRRHAESVSVDSSSMANPGDPYLEDEIRKCIESLPEKESTVFRLNRFGGLTYAETADFLGVSQKTVEKHMSRALRTLRGALERYLVVLLVLAASCVASFTAANEAVGRQTEPPAKNVEAVALRQPVRFDASTESLRSVLGGLSTQTNVGIVFDDVLVAGREVTASCVDCSLGEALELVLGPHGLSYDLLGSRVIALVTDSNRRRTVTGRVVDGETGEPLELAQVRIGRRGDAADRNGVFQVDVAEEGSRVLSVSHLGYRRETVELTEESSADLGTIRLAPRDIMVGELTVLAAPVIPAGRDAEGARILSGRTIGRIPTLGTGDPLGALRTLPGIDGTEERSGELFIRGGTPRTNLILWDGIPIFNVDHFFGMISTFSAQAVERVRMYERGAPASLGGRVGTVVEMESPPGRGATQFLGHSSPFASGLSIRLPAGSRAGAWISARRSTPLIEQQNEYSALFENVLGDRAGEDRPGFTFRDVSTRMDFMPADRHLVSVSFHHSDDAINRRDEESLRQFAFENIPEPDDDDDIDEPDDDDDDDPDDDADEPDDAADDAAGKRDDDVTARIVRINQSERFDNDWGVTGFALNWTAEWITDAPMHVRAVRSQSRNTFSLMYTESEEDSVLASTFERQKNTLTYDAVSARQSFPTPLGQLTLGGFFERTGTDRSLREGSDEQSTIDTLWTRDLRVGGLHATQHVRVRAVRLDVGVRLSNVDVTGRWYVSPRLAVRAHPTDLLSLTASWGRYHQFMIRSLDAELSGNPRNEWRLLAAPDQAARSTQTSAGVSLGNNRLIVSADVWQRWGSGIPVLPATASDPVAQPFSTDRTRAVGFEVAAQGRIGGLLGIFSYARTDIDARSEQFGQTGWFDALYERPHALKGVLSIRTGPVTSGMKYSWASGRPVGALVSATRFISADGSEIRGSGAPNLANRRLPAYSRLDLQVTWKRPVGAMHSSFSIALINVLDRENVRVQRLFTESSTVHFRDVGMLGFTPVVSFKLGFDRDRRDD